MNRPHHAIVEDQFGPRANAYVSSAVHAAGEDLDALEAIVRRIRPARALDLGSGARAGRTRRTMASSASRSSPAAWTALAT